MKSILAIILIAGFSSAIHYNMEEFSKRSLLFIKGLTNELEVDYTNENLEICIDDIEDIINKILEFKKFTKNIKYDTIFNFIPTLIETLIQILNITESCSNEYTFLKLTVDYISMDKVIKVIGKMAKRYMKMVEHIRISNECLKKDDFDCIGGQIGKALKFFSIDENNEGLFSLFEFLYSLILGIFSGLGDYNKEEQVENCIINLKNEVKIGRAHV